MSCCAYHSRTCEPPSELCCAGCTEAAHPAHADGSECAAPDLSGYHLGGVVPGPPQQVYLFPGDRLYRADGSVLRWTGTQWVRETRRWR